MRADILTPRLLLRDVTEADAEHLFKLDADPEVMRYIGPRPATTVEPYRERIRTVYVPHQQHPWHGIRLILDRTSLAFLGWVFVRPAVASSLATAIGWVRPTDEEVGYRLLREAWGHGYATEAASAMLEAAIADPATTAIVACADAGHTASMRVLAKLGLHRMSDVYLPDHRETVSTWQRLLG